MHQHKPIAWIRDLYHDKDESFIAEAEYNFRELVLFLYFSDIEINKDTKTTLTEMTSGANVDTQ